ncbi:MAG TPA: ABC transporter ATP-binding protein [Noviherbaspirillum sp.]|nr:ABC transporter ATP-binding protein [Noviherbaspirillum sp.]
MSHPLKVNRLSKSYGARKAVDDVSLCVCEGEFVALLGPNGAGKTTLFQMLTGLFTADSGSAQIVGHDFVTAPLAALAQLGVVFQQPALDLDLTVIANLQFHSDLHGIPRAEARNRIQHWLQRFGLHERARDKARELSGGNRRKVELARALLTCPRLLLMDEATVGIDPASRAQILADVKSLCADGLGVLWATHLIDEAEAADRVVVMAKGTVRFDGSAQELIALHGHAGLTDAFLHLTQAERLAA